MPPPRILTEENAIDVLNECQQELGTLFGSNEESRGVGITGAVEFVDLDGPSLIVRLRGRFWHQRTAVVDRVEKFMCVRSLDPWIHCFVTLTVFARCFLRVQPRPNSRVPVGRD